MGAKKSQIDDLTLAWAGKIHVFRKKNCHHAKPIVLVLVVLLLKSKVLFSHFNFQVMNLREKKNLDYFPIHNGPELKPH